MPELPFSSPRRKVSRSLNHISELEYLLEKYFAEKWCDVSFGRNPTSGEYELHTNVNPPPSSASEVIGDAIHNLRSALDLLAVELARTNPRNDHGVNGVRFPFCKEPSDLNEMIKRAKFTRAGPECVDALIALKPYPDGNLALRALHDLDIRDKHVSLIVASCQISTPPIGFVMEDDRVTPKGFREGKLELELKGDPIPSVKFVFPANLPLGGEPVLPTLHYLVRTVSDIIDRFDAIRTRSIWE